MGPIHQSIHIFWSRELGRPLVLHAVFPEIFVSDEMVLEKQGERTYSDDVGTVDRRT